MKIVQMSPAAAQAPWVAQLPEEKQLYMQQVVPGQ